jgi:pimeloyl-ACP methyl ester carboxylesterase
MNAAVEEPATRWPFYTDPEFADVREIRTAYRRSGEGEAILYLHGAGLTRRWLPFYEHLSAHGDVIVPEHPGFGDTKPMPAWLRSVDDLVLHYDDLLEVLGVGDIHLVGHSLGGWIAAAFAVTYPRRIKSLTLIAPMGLRVPGSPITDFFRLTPEEEGDALLNGHPERYLEYLEEGDPLEARIQGYLELTTTARLAFSPRYDVRLDRTLARVTAPALVVAVDDDRIIPRAHCDRYAELLPDGRLEVLSGGELPTGHLPIVQEPRALADLIGEFITTSRSRT